MTWCYLRNLFQESMATYDYSPDAELIGAAISNGRFAVVTCVTAHCPSTDAVLPNTRNLICKDEDRNPLSFPTQDAAVAYARELLRASPADDEDYDELFRGYLIWTSTGPIKGYVQLEDRPAEEEEELTLEDLPF